MNDLAHARFEKLTAGEQHFLVPDVRCANCCLTIEKALDGLPEVSNVNVNYAEKRLSFSALTPGATQHVIDRLTEMGYQSAPERYDEGMARFREERRRLLARLGVAGIGMMQVMMFALASYVAGPQGIEDAYWNLMQWASMIIALPVTFYSAMPFHKGALRDLRNFSLGMDVPVSLAILSAFTLSTIHTITQSGEVYFDSACMFTFFLLTGRYLELTARQAFHVDQSLGEHLLPDFARRDSGEIVDIEQLGADDVIVIRKGEVIPADAVVLEGQSSVDESAFTGESGPVIKTVGAKILAGTSNLDGELTARVLSEADDWVISHLSELYRKSASFRPAFAAAADVIARYFVSAVLLLAAGSGIYWWLAGSEDYFAIALAVLVVSCPCALSLATPVAYTIASGAVRQLGVLVSNGAFLEKLSEIDAVVFDKTGTLTEGTLRLEQIALMNHEYSRDEVVSIAASLEVTSLHPVALSLREETRDLVALNDIEISAGFGISGTKDGVTYKIGKAGFATAEAVSAPDDSLNWVLLSRDDAPLAWFGFSDRLREGVDAVVDETQRRFNRVEVFSGDTSDRGRLRLHELGFQAPRMGMTPDGKIDGLQQLQADGNRVLMLGDGLNDAGAMAVANVSLAVNPVDSVVQSAADATLVNGSLASLPGLFDYARRVKRIIRQNLGWALAYNFSVIPLAIVGLVPPWVAALGMSMSSLFVTLNACRLARVPVTHGGNA